MRQAHWLAVAWVGIGRVAGLGAKHFLKHQHVSRVQGQRAGAIRQTAVYQRGLGCACGQATRGIAPGIKLHGVVFWVQADGPCLRSAHRLEHLI